jgi:AraC-like DNA-binding protein
MPGMTDLEHHRLYRSATVTVTDVACRCRDRAAGPEEYSDRSNFAFTRRGVFVKHIGREAVVADPNQVVFFNAGEPYRVSHPAAGGDDCTSFTFAPDVLADAVARYDPAVRDRPGPPFRFTHAPSGPADLVLQHQLRRCLPSLTGPDLAADELAVTLLGSVVAAAYRVRGARPVGRRPATERAHRERAAATQALLAARFPEPLGLDEIARAVHSSPFHLARLFRRATGLPIHRYRLRLRLAAALERLAGGADDLTALALDLGFSSHSHFSDAFRRAFHLPPSQFRRRLTTARLRELSKKLTA